RGACRSSLRASTSSGPQTAARALAGLQSRSERPWFRPSLSSGWERIPRAAGTPCTSRSIAENSPPRLHGQRAQKQTGPSWPGVGGAGQQRKADPSRTGQKPGVIDPAVGIQGAIAGHPNALLAHGQRGAQPGESRVAEAGVAGGAPEAVEDVRQPGAAVAEPSVAAPIPRGHAPARQTR